MKKIAYLLFVTLLFVLVLGCENPSSGSITSTLDTVITTTYNAENVSFKMVYVTDNGTYPAGTDDDSTGVVDGDYWIGETEVTYELWSTVYTWATSVDRNDNRYTFLNAGAQGGDADDDDLTALGSDQHPVTSITWQDMIVWCNALTEWYNIQEDTTNQCVYTYNDVILRDASDATTANTSAVDADGFRLPTSYEWELAARYRGSDSTNTVEGYSNPYYTTGKSISGDTQVYDAETPTFGKYAVYNEDDDDDTGSTAVVKTKLPNALGIYDMSGNVAEYCFDKYYLIYPYVMGGSWNYNVDEMLIGGLTGSTPLMFGLATSLNGVISFRLVMTAN